MSGSELLSALASLREALNEAAVEHVYIGALPVLAWGRPRATTDLDVVVFCDQPGFSRLETALQAREIKPGRHVGPADPADSLPDIAVFWTTSTPSIRLDLFIAKMEFERAVLENARPATVLGAPLTVASCEASIIYKLLASRSKDVADVEGMFEARVAAGAAIDWQFLDHWAEEWGIPERLAPYRARFRP